MSTARTARGAGIVAAISAAALSACSAVQPPAPNRPDVGAHVVDVVNRSDAPVEIVHNGRTGSGSGRLDEVVAACEAFGWGMMQEEGWQLLVNGEEVLDGGIIRGPDGAPRDVRTTVEIAADGDVTVSALEPYTGPPEERRAVPGCPST